MITVNMNIGTSHKRKAITPATVTRTQAGNERRKTQTISRSEMVTLNRTCPGAALYLRDQRNPSTFQEDLSECLNSTFHARVRRDLVYGVCGGQRFCQFLVQVPDGNIVHVQLQPMFPQCKDDSWESGFYSGLNQSLRLLRASNCDVPKSFMSTSNQLLVSHNNIPKLEITFQAVPDRLLVKSTSYRAGYMTALLPDKFCFSGVQVCESLRVPEGHVVMIGFERLASYLHIHSLTLHLDARPKMELEVEKFFFEDYKEGYTFDAKQLRVCVTLNWTSSAEQCFKMFFAFLPKSRTPERLSSGLYNCSVYYYERFRRHFECNMKAECADGRDERACDFTSRVCKGWVAAPGKCYKLISFHSAVTSTVAAQECKARGSNLAALKNTNEIDQFKKLFYYRIRQEEPVMTGLCLGARSKPFIYRKFLKWHENTLIYTAEHLDLRLDEKVMDMSQSRFYGYVKTASDDLIFAKVNKETKRFLCEKLTGTIRHSFLYKPHDRNLPRSILEKHMLFRCPSGQMIRTFLSCDPKSGCGQSVCTFSNMTSLVLPDLSVSQEEVAFRVPMYTCLKDKTDISFTLVCDFRNDCEDQSDESFCRYPQCEQFSCKNGQCVSWVKKCDEYSDCLDDSDENDCQIKKAEWFRLIYGKRKFYDRMHTYLDSMGHFDYTYNTQMCDYRYYRCTTLSMFCMPIYLRCNGFNDCLYQEDERDCEDITCPGLYRCRDSTVCVHVDNLCDGLPQCPQRDDEWLCKLKCPPQCLCQGHVYLCSRQFPAHSHSDLRALDARGSGMKLNQLTGNPYLVHLILAACSIHYLPELEFLNVQMLDLSYNKITSIVMNVFLNFPNLRVLVLRGNPLTSLTGRRSLQQQEALRTVDLSQTYLGKFEGQIFSLTPGVRYLNLSFCTMHSIGQQKFQSLHQLKILDIRGTSIKPFPLDAFHGLDYLEVVFSPHYRLCCDDLFRNRALKAKCVAPQGFSSSCHSLFESEMYRLTFIFLSILVVLGNMACFLSNLIFKTKVCIFIVNLQCANLCMGIYTSIITTAHEMHRGRFSRYEQKWTASVACKVAGFLSLMSSEVSVLLIFLFTLDHLIVLRFANSTYRFKRVSAAVACAITWLFGIFLASIPLFPALSNWGKYGQASICTVMVHNLLHSEKTFGLFHCTVAFNFLNCLGICAGQIIIRISMPKPQTAQESSMKHMCASVGLKMKIAVTDAIGWIVITVTSVVYLTDTAGSEKLNMFMAVLVLPLNSAVNPLLCLWQTLTHRQRQKQEERLLRALKSRLRNN